jgi:hypothetical protein
MSYTIVFLDGNNLVKIIGRYPSPEKAVTIAKYMLQCQGYENLSYMIVPYVMSATKDYT